MAFKQDKRMLSTVLLKLFSLIHTALTNESVLVLGHDDIEIHFDQTTFKSFYSCLCNTGMKLCFASSNFLLEQRADITNIEPDYNSSLVFSGATQCSVSKDEMNEKPFYTIDCTSGRDITICHHRMTLLSNPDEANLTCGSPFVEIGWEGNITVQHFDNRTLKLEKCKTDLPAECKIVTMNRNEISPGITTFLPGSMLTSNINLVIISIVLSCALIVIILASILIYKTNGRNIFCMKVTNVGIKDDELYQNFTELSCSPTTSYENQTLSCVDTFSNAFTPCDQTHSFKQSLPTATENVQVSGDKMFKGKKTSQENLDHFSNTIVKTKHMAGNGQHSPGHVSNQDYLTPGDIEAKMGAASERLCSFNETNARVHRTLPNPKFDTRTKILSKTKPKACKKISPLNIDDAGYTIIDSSDSFPCTSKVTRDANRAWSNTEDINCEVLYNHASKSLRNIKCKSNQTILERALPEIPDGKDQMYENDSTIKSPTSLCDGYEVPIIKSLKGCKVYESEHELKVNGLVENSMTSVDWPDDDYEVAVVNAHLVPKTLSGNAKIGTVYRSSPCVRDRPSNELGSQSHYDKSDGLCRDIISTEEMESEHQNSRIQGPHPINVNSENESFSKLRMSVRGRKNSYDKYIPKVLKDAETNNEKEPTFLIQSSTHKINETAAKHSESSGLCENEQASSLRMEHQCEYLVKDGENAKNQQKLERRKDCARKYYVLERTDDD